jgi:hypothetical protein
MYQARQCMALKEIENVDKELLAARYEAAVMTEFIVVLLLR